MIVSSLLACVSQPRSPHESRPSSADTGTSGPRCAHRPCIDEVEGVVSVPESGTFDRGGERIAVTRDLAYVVATGNHVAAYELPALQWVGEWAGPVGTVAVASETDVAIGMGLEDAAVVVTGPPLGTVDLDPRSWTRGERGSALGAGLAVGDIDLDGEVEVLATAPNERAPGSLLVLGMPSLAWSSDSPGVPVGIAIRDLDADGVPELIEAGSGVRRFPLPLEGVLSREPWLSGTGDRQVIHELGDVTGDGLPDLGISEDSWRARGSLWILAGGRTDVTSLAELPGIHGAEDSYFGWAAVTADLDHDGVLDLAVSAPGWFDPGAIHVFRGPVQLPATPDDADAVVWGAEPLDDFGRSLAVVATDDGPALLIGAPGAYRDTGSLSLVPGTSWC